MPQSEFDIIKQYFVEQNISRDDVELGIGDDAAILSVPEGKQLVIALDTLVAGVHFPENTSAEDIGHKALAVNLSDLAAMGAEPAWFTLALTLPVSEASWLSGFASGLLSLASRYNMQLVGGDTTQGPLTVSVQIAGYVPTGRAITRSGAKPGDKIYVTGNTGDAALGLQCTLHPEHFSSTPSAIERLNRPEPRVEAGMLIRDMASACIDISDGLLSDLGHVLEQSKVGARVERDAIPLSDSLRGLCAEDESYYRLALSGGDDYELCFCIPPAKEQVLQNIAVQLGVPVTCIGEIESQAGLRLYSAGQLIEYNSVQGYEHFK